VFGWSQRARLLPDGATEITVVSLPRGSAPPASAAFRPAEASLTLDGADALPSAVRHLAQEIALDARGDAWNASERIITWVSLNVRHEDDPGHGDTALEALESRRASCVGRSLLASDLLRAAGIPARTIHGLLAEQGDGRPFVLHRFVEGWIDGIGWVPSDPGESVHLVDARHVFVASEDASYDPESQRGLSFRIGERQALPLASAHPPTMRALVVRDRPRQLGVQAGLP